GGAGLMSPVTVPGDAGPGAYLTLGTGTRSAAPSARVVAYDRAEPVDGTDADALWAERYPGRALPLGPFVLDVGPYVRANAGRARPGLLGQVLLAARRTVAVFGNADTEAGIHRPAMLVGMDPQGDGIGGRIGVARVPRPGGLGPPLLRPIARPDEDALGGYRTDFGVLSFEALGNRIPNPSPWLPAHVTVFDMGDTTRIDDAAEGVAAARVRRERREALARIGGQVAYLVGRAAAHDVLVIVLAPSTSRDMDARKDLLTPIVMARGDPAALFPEEGDPHALTSATTRRVGVVSNEDLAPTILRFFGLFLRPGMRGAPIRVVEDAPAPFALHARHLANRRMSIPIQAAAAAAAAAAALLCLGLIVRGAGAPDRLRRAGAWLALCLPMAALALLLAGHLPTLSYATVVPTVVAVTVFGTLVHAPLRRVSVPAPAVAVALTVLLALVAETALGWSAALTPFLGGSELDGARFYGMPNAFIGLLVGCGLWVASRLRPWSGGLVLLALALLAGLPGAGANLGAGITLSFAAGLWVAVRARGTLGLPEAVAGVVGAALGGVVIVGAHALLAPSPTHVTRFIEGGPGLGGIPGTLADRLAIGLRMVARHPLAAIPPIGALALVPVLRRPPAPIRPALGRHPAWWDALLVGAAAGVVAYLVNDTGPTAAGLCFGTALAGLCWVVLAEEPPPPSPTPGPAAGRTTTAPGGKMGEGADREEAAWRVRTGT
ncbi:MAG TPA: hypothetical protein VNO17_12735, partial [Actinomycetota bacterium]|nr:hypothetical protein [Actinomycetota bacterium]